MVNIYEQIKNNKIRSGVIISIFSAVTQVNDAALSFVPKMIFVSAFILFTLPWVGEHIETFTIELWNMILIFGK